MFESAVDYQALGVTVRHLRVVPVVHRPAVRLAELLQLAPSAVTLTEIDEYDDADLDEGERVMLLTLWERHDGWLAARRQQAIVAVAGPAPASRGDDDWGQLDVATALRLSPASTSRRVAIAREL